MSLTQNRYRHLLYAGGWLLAPGDVNPPDGWPSLSLGSYRLSFAPAWPVGSVGPVVVFGRPVDPRTGASGAAYAAEMLAAARSNGSFLDALDQLAGRFLVFVDGDDGPEVYQDAAGTRAVFYRPPVAASHSALAAADPDDKSSEVARVWQRTSRSSVNVRYLPGVRGPHEGVRMLTPNTRLRVHDGEVQRFWPRKPRVENPDIDALAARVAEILSRTAQAAARAWPLMMSLTAGLDSRLTLAACRDITDRIDFFSHVNPVKPNRGHKVDLDVAQDMARELGLAHHVYPLGEPAKGERYDEFLEVWLHNVGIRRGLPALMKGYVDGWPPGTLHVRSNVAEIGRVFYRGERLSTISSAALTRRWNWDMGEDPDCIAAFDEFCKVTQFNDEAMLSYDPLDIFYWEHRVGTWHAWLCSEADVAHDTFPVYSSRALLETMLAAPFDDRLNAVLFYKAIALMWPEVSRWPINPKRWPPKPD